MLLWVSNVQRGDPVGKFSGVIRILTNQSATGIWTAKSTDGVDVSRSLLDDEDGSCIVLGVGVRLFTVDNLQWSPEK